MVVSKYVTEICCKKGQRYVVRMPDETGKVRTRTFSFAKYASKTQALKAALAYRDCRAKERGLNLQFRSCVLKRSDPTRVPGVMLVKQERGAKSQQQGITFEWVALVGNTGKAVKRKSFSILKYGYAKAWSLAYEVRANYLGSTFQQDRQPPKPTSELVFWAKERGINL